MDKCKSTASASQNCTKKLRIFLLVFIVVLLRTSSCFGRICKKDVPRAEPTLRFLSIKGIEHMFELGKFLRYRYDGFIPSRYRYTDVNVLSTSVDRCLMSAEALLAGLYPPVGDQIWNAELPWQPIPVHSGTSSMDDMLAVSKACPLLSKEQEIQANISQSILSRNQELLHFLSKKTGSEFQTIFDISSLYDNLKITRRQGYKLPEWTRRVYPCKLKPFALLALIPPNSTFTTKKLESGVLINDIVSNMKNKMNSTTVFDRLLSLYSAHDVTLARLWQGMNVIQELKDGPDFGATFIIELHEIDNKYQVKILYKKHAWGTKLSVLSIKGCENDKTTQRDGMCDFDIFLAAMQPVLITNFDAECQIPQQSSVPEMTSATQRKRYFQPNSRYS